MKPLVYLSVVIVLMSYFTVAFQVDFELAPKVTSIFPKTEVFEIDSDSVFLDFGFQVKNYSQIKDCSLILNSEMNSALPAKKSDILAYETNIISYNLSLGNYTWKVLCTDIKNQTGISEERNLRLTKKIVEPNRQNTTKILIVITLILMIFLISLGILTSKSMKIYFEERRQQIAREKLREKLKELAEKSKSFERI